MVFDFNFLSLHLKEGISGKQLNITRYDTKYTKSHIILMPKKCHAFSIPVLTAPPRSASVSTPDRPKCKRRRRTRSPGHEATLGTRKQEVTRHFDGIPGSPQPPGGRGRVSRPKSLLPPSQSLTQRTHERPSPEASLGGTQGEGAPEHSPPPPRSPASSCPGWAPSPSFPSVPLPALSAVSLCAIGSRLCPRPGAPPRTPETRAAPGGPPSAPPAVAQLPGRPPSPRRSAPGYGLSRPARLRPSAPAGCSPSTPARGQGLLRTRIVGWERLPGAGAILTPEPPGSNRGTSPQSLLVSVYIQHQGRPEVHGGSWTKQRETKNKKTGQINHGMKPPKTLRQIKTFLLDLFQIP
uniref:leucine-rich repeat extensin-like protein 5 n=1 Tax=Ictidomys tridecemlineatus TaxID=43179 RepID=UPI001A9CDB94|nr:leucine-rich repeat extensin-like protein 5 [Ictidomys tridecemlineatus]